MLVVEGPARLTTTSVAERAGASVSTMYQKFPHKRALFHAVDESYLDVLAGQDRGCLPYTSCARGGDQRFDLRAVGHRWCSELD